MSAPTANRPAIGVFTPTRAQIPERTLRTDLWWLPPLLTNLGLLAFICYATTRAFWGSQYWVEKYHYLTPFYSPCVSASCQPGASHLGVWFGHFPGWIPLGAMVLPFLLGFRLTCYYYRKAYYRSVWQSPTSCAVPEPRAHYTGETRLPLIVQNTHRYFFYIAVVVSLINTYDAIAAFHSPSGFGFGLGNVILTINVVLLWAYTISCHSCRHATGGAQAFLQAPSAILDLDTGQQAQYPTHAIRVDHAGDPGAHRFLHHAGGQWQHHRSQIYWLKDRFRS